MTSTSSGWTVSLDRLTTDPAVERNPTWSPDGTTLVFARDDDGDRATRSDYDLYLYDVATGAIEPLIDNDVTDGNPVWSPDGRQIAFYRGEGAGFHIRVIGADATAADDPSEDLMPDRSGVNLDPNWR